MNFQLHMHISIVKVKSFKDCASPLCKLSSLFTSLFVYWKIHLLCSRWDHRRSCCWNTQSESTWCPPAHTPPTKRDMSRGQRQNINHPMRVEIKKRGNYRRRKRRKCTCSAFRVSSMNICCSFSFTKLMQNCSNPFFWWRDNMFHKIHTGQVSFIFSQGWISCKFNGLCLEWELLEEGTHCAIHSTYTGPWAWALCDGGLQLPV